MHMNWHLHDRLHHVHIGHEDAEAILVGLGALLASLAATGIIAIILRVASGKW